MDLVMDMMGAPRSGLDSWTKELSQVGRAGFYSHRKVWIGRDFKNSLVPPLPA